MHINEVERINVLVTTLNKAIGELYVGGFTIFMTISSKKLLQILKRLQPAIQSSPSIPVLENVSFEPGRCAATNTNLTIIAELPECEERFLLPCNILINVISMATGDITIDKGNITDATGKKWKIALPADQTFVALPVFDSSFSQVVNSDFFYSLANADKCKDRETNRIIIYSCIDFPAGCIVGTNGAMLYKETLPIKGAQQCLVDGSFVKAVSMFQDAEINVNERFISVKENGIEVICTLSEGKFVDYSSVIPERKDINFICDKNELLQAVKSMNVYGSFVTKVLLTFEPGKLKISFTDTKNESDISIPCEHSVSFDEIGLDYTFMLTLLGCMTGDAVKAVFTAFNYPVMIYEENKTLLLMPYKI